MCRYFLRKVHRKKLVGKKRLISNIENRLKLLQLDIVEQKNVKTQVLKSTNYKLNSSKIETYDEIINNRKYKDQEDLVKIKNPHDKVYNLTLIKNNFEKLYSDYVGKLSKINKNSSNIRVKTKFKNIYYYWKFRDNVLEISLEFSNAYLELTKYFNSIEKILKQSFNETLIVGQTKTKTVIYISTVKYSLYWAMTTMHSFISIIDSKLEIFYDNVQNENITYIDGDDYKEIDEVNIDNTEYNTNENDIVDEQEYIHLNIIDGQTSTVKLTIYERNPKNRAEAIKIHGTTCYACGFNFNDFYGEDLSKDFIEIHHIKPVSGGEYIVNPRTDLVPLCSNCHSMIHKEKNPPKTIEEIKNRYKRF